MGETRTCAIYVRISDAREGDVAGVGRQEADSRALAERRGWMVGEVYAENDTSAFKRRRMRLPNGRVELRVDRPAFRRMLDDMASGEVDALIGYDLDRVARDPRDLEDLIDVVEQNKIPTDAVTGSLDLSTDAGITMARVMVAMANKSSRDTGRRVTRTHLDLARDGKVGGGGIRAYGYTADGRTVVDTEAEIVREMARRIIDGESLGAVARDLTVRGVPPVRAAAWNTRSVHAILSRPRIAGLREYKGEIVGEAAWPAILDQETWALVKDALAKRAEHPSGNRLIAWLTGVLWCGRCPNWLSYGQQRGRRRYWCDPRRDGCHLVIDAEGAEETVGGWILEYLQRPDVLDRIGQATAAEHIDHARHEAAEDEQLLAELGREFDARRLPVAEYMRLRKPVVERLEKSRALMRAKLPDGMRRLLEAGDVPAVWAALQPVERREVTRVVFPNGIRVAPATKGRFAAYESERLTPID